jgi:hypothetical protein
VTLACSTLLIENRVALENNLRRIVEVGPLGQPLPDDPASIESVPWVRTVGMRKRLAWLLGLGTSAEAVRVPKS